MTSKSKKILNITVADISYLSKRGNNLSCSKCYRAYVYCKQFRLVVVRKSRRESITIYSTDSRNGIIGDSLRYLIDGNRVAL